MNKKISTRQLIIFYCIYSFSIKFIMLPSLLAKTAGVDAWIAAIIGTVLELVTLYIALTVLVRNQDTDIYSTLKRTKQYGQWSIMLLMLFIFVLQLLILLNQAFHLLNNNLFENIPLQYFSVPLLIMGIFFCMMPARAVFRSGEIFFVFIIIGIAISVFPAVTNMNPSEVLPVFDKGISPSITAFYQNIIFFESAFMLLIFSGEVKIEKHFRKKFMGFAAFLGLFFVFFVFMFTSLFGPLAPIKDIAVTDFTLYSAYFSSGGRLDWVLITIWLLLLFLRFGITFFCAYTCLRHITGLKGRAGILSTILAIFIYVISVFVFTTSRELNNFIANIPWLIAVLYIAVPLLFLVISFARRRVQ